MISKVGNGDIKIDEITALYLKDKDGNMVELDKGLFTYDYCCNGFGKKELKIECHLSTPTITATTNNTFDRAHDCIEEYTLLAGSSCPKQGIKLF